MNSIQEAVAGALPATESRDLRELRILSERVAELQAELAEVEDQAKILKGQINDVLTRKMPDAMLGAGFGFGDSIDVDGRGYKLELLVRGSWPKNAVKAERAYEQLEEYGATDLVRQSLIAEFPEDEVDEIKKWQELLAQYAQLVEVKRTVHPQTLMAFARERFKAGEDINFDRLGLYNAPIVRVRK